MCDSFFNQRTSCRVSVSPRVFDEDAKTNLSSELTWPFLFLLLHKLDIQNQLSRLITGDSVIFEDALGRIRYLPFEFFQHWDVSSLRRHPVQVLDLTDLNCRAGLLSLFDESI